MTVQVARSTNRLAGQRPLQARNLTGELVARLGEEIAAGKLTPGDRLPTEQELMVTFGVSRTVVREAVAALRSEGLVTTRQGVGAFVAADVQRRPFRIDPDRLHSIDDVVHVMELRMGIEIEAAGIAAERHTPRRLKAIRTALEAIDAALAKGDAAVEADFEFHRAIVRATDNSYFSEFLEFLGRFIIPRQNVRTEQGSPEELARYLDRVQGEHRAIFDAIAATAPDQARAAMRLHLSNSRERYRGIAAKLHRSTGRSSK